jgi:hypothetical protein
MNTQVPMRFVVLPALVWLTIALSGCGTPSCTFIAIKIAPQRASADHGAVPPANGLQFTAVAATTPPGCALTHSNPQNVTWSVSDSVHTSISNVHDQTFGTATCLGATTGSATVTASMPSGSSAVSATAMLTCQ